jgi:hypothetical protein
MTVCLMTAEQPKHVAQSEDSVIFSKKLLCCDWYNIVNVLKHNRMHEMKFIYNVSYLQSNKQKGHK